MKKLSMILLSVSCAAAASAQVAAKMEVKEDIPGLCNKNDVYALFPSFDGQVEAQCPVSKKDLLHLLNTKVAYLDDNPKYMDKGMISLVINCKGEVVQCKMDVKTLSSELDKQIEAVFNSLGTWNPGKLNGIAVDTSKLITFKIKKGKFTFEE